MAAIGRQARRAARDLALAATGDKNAALAAMAAALRRRAAAIAAANDADLGARPKPGPDRGISRSVAARPGADRGNGAIARGHCRPARPGRADRRQWVRPNGLEISRVSVPIGVIGIIFESRPNVTADAAGLSMKAGNAAILRSGSDSLRSAQAIAAGSARGAGARQPAGRRRPACAHRRPRGCRADARGPRRRHRCHRAARRAQPRRPRPGRSPGAGARPSRGHLPCLCRCQRRYRHGAGHHRQCQDAADRGLRRGRNGADRPPGRRQPGGRPRRGADRCRLRGAWRFRGASRRPPRGGRE